MGGSRTLRKSTGFVMHEEAARSISEAAENFISDVKGKFYKGVYEQWNACSKPSVQLRRNMPLLFTMSRQMYISEEEESVSDKMFALLSYSVVMVAK